MFAFILWMCLHSRPTVALENGPVFTPESFTIDYGTVAYDSKTDRELYFTNTGNQPLLIESVRSSCGCAYATWPKEPVAPGRRNKITIRYDTKRIGPFTKTFNVYSNEFNGGNSKEHNITIKGTVLEAAVSPGNLSVPDVKP